MRALPDIFDFDDSATCSPTSSKLVSLEAEVGMLLNRIIVSSLDPEMT